MKTIEQQTLVSFIEPALEHVEDKQLRAALQQALANQEPALQTIERFFEKIGSQNWTETSFKLIFNGWKETHLKMLAIYGLSCRMQRMGLESDVTKEQQHLLFLAAAKNAETSYEDLGLDFDALVEETGNDNERSRLRRLERSAGIIPPGTAGL